MPLNKVNPKSNMYQGWITHTWNTIKGKCPHGCEYCYMKKWGEQPDLHFDEKELKANLGEDNFIFVGSSCDMFAGAIHSEWIFETLKHCKEFANKYLFQSKNPSRIKRLMHYLPPDSIAGTTIETDRIYKEMGNAPPPGVRSRSMAIISRSLNTMVTVEPIMAFNLNILVMFIENCKPKWVNIGANTNYKIKLPEPEPEKILALIDRLEKFTEVKIKKNLNRLMI